MIVLIRRLLAEQPRRFIAVVLVLGVAGIFEGLGVAAVVPLLELLAAGQGTATAASGIVSKLVASVIGLLHLPFTLASVLAFILFFILAQQATTVFQQKLAQGSIFRFEADLRARLYRAVFEADWPFFLKEKSADVISALTMETTRASQAYQYLNQMLGAGIVVGVYVVLAFVLSWQMALLVAIAGVLIALLLRRRAGRGAVFGLAVTEDNAELQREASESIAGAKLVKGTGVEEKAVERFGEFVHRLASQQYKQQMNQAWLKAFFDTLSISAVFGGLFMAASYFRMPFSDLIVFMFVFYRISPRLSTLQVLGHNVLSYLPALERVDDVTARAAARRERSGGAPVAPLADAVALENVDFGYDGGSLVVRDVSLRIGNGTCVAIVGESGSGKTTVMDLLMGLVIPSAGVIAVDGVPLTDLDLHSWRERIGYVAQDSTFFHLSVRENIRFTAPDAGDERIERAARLANAHDFIVALPNGYDTIVGDRGVRLSGGQRQRVALARAIVRDPDLLILDEATSALDAESEKRIQQAIAELARSMTVVIVTHRLATVRDADLIYVLDDGRLIEQGSWEELLALGGRFARLEQLQKLDDGVTPGAEEAP
jgi:ABC-type multidrug transport system fused ATPase/permease subunit